LDEKDAYLVDKYSISYLTVGRDVLRLSSQSKYIPTAPLIIADPDYDLDNSSTTIETPFQRLSGTIQEGKFVANLFNGEPLVGKRALKRALREIRSPRILHLSTHGFFLPNIVSEPSVMPTILRPSTNISKTGLDRLTGQRLVNPMLRSGLALAGANTWLQGNKPDEAAENGLLFAEDVIGLDLLDTEMVVLSACDTGLGDVLAGEGVYGLRRAFLIAGAKTLVMSLWKVPDTQTKELMVSFYQNIAAGVPRAWALRKAQLALKDKHANPFFWGAFICQGDPSLLPMLSPGGIS
jgi:CHAT domain-containing protein